MNEVHPHNADERMLAGRDGRENVRMNDEELVGYLRRCNEADNHRYAEVAGRFGEEALLDSHLPMLDLIDELAREWQGMEPADDRYAGLTYALRVVSRAYLSELS